MKTNWSYVLGMYATIIVAVALATGLLVAKSHHHWQWHFGVSTILFIGGVALICYGLRYAYCNWNDGDSSNDWRIVLVFIAGLATAALLIVTWSEAEWKDSYATLVITAFVLGFGSIIEYCRRESVSISPPTTASP